MGKINTSFRAEEGLWSDFKVVAAAADRSATKHLEFLMKKAVDDHREKLLKAANSLEKSGYGDLAKASELKAQHKKGNRK